MEKIEGHRLLFKAIVGSQAYGTNTPESDVDLKGVYIQSDDDILSFKYKEQINVTKDECYYEIRRFLELLAKGNPTMLELLYSPDDCIEYITPEFQLLIDNRDKFLTKECYKAFAGYGLAQISKATGLNKKQNIEREKVSKKDLLDFCYVIEGERTINLKKYLKRTGYDLKFMGTTNIPNAKDLYSVFYDHTSHSCFSEMVDETTREYNKRSCSESGILFGFGYKGLVKVGEDENYGISNQLRLSSIPKGEIPIFIMSYNKDGYTKYCKDYKEYQEWIKNRNVQRYVDYTKHGQSYDCYLDSETEFFTKNGWKKYDDINIDDKIATISDNLELYFNSYTDRYKEKYSGKIYSFENRYTSFSVTPNHNLFISDVHRSNNNGFSFKYIQKESNWHFESIDSYMKSKKSWKHIVLSLVNNTTESINLSKEDLILIGAYISDGCMSDNAIVIDQKEEKKLTTTLRDIQTLNHTEHSWFRKERNTYYNKFRFPSGHLSNILKDIGDGSLTKRIPSYFMNLSKIQFDFLLRGLLEGDGSKHKKSGHWIYYTSNYGLAVDLQTLLFLNGYNSQIYTVNHKGGFEGSSEIKYQVFISKNIKNIGIIKKDFLTKITSDGLNKKSPWLIREVSDEFISCFTMNSGVLITRRNNKIAVQGNSKNMLHTMRLIETAEEIATQGTINVRRENAQELLKIRRGEVNLEDILTMAQDRIKGIDELYEKSNLPESIDMDYVNSILLQIRHMSKDSLNIYWNGNSDFEYGVKVLLSETPISKSIMKALEELSELSTKLLQYVNKPEQITDSDIEEEIVDCEMHFNLLKNYFPVSASTRLRKIKKMLKSKDFKNYEKRYLDKNNAD